MVFPQPEGAIIKEVTPSFIEREKSEKKVRLEKKAKQEKRARAETKESREHQENLVRMALTERPEQAAAVEAPAAPLVVEMAAAVALAVLT